MAPPSQAAKSGADPWQNMPVYAIESVDHALRLAVLLQQEGPLRVTEAAERLGVAGPRAPPARHARVPRVSRRYAAGPVLWHPFAVAPVTDPREVAETSS